MQEAQLFWQSGIRKVIAGLSVLSDTWKKEGRIVWIDKEKKHATISQRRKICFRMDKNKK